MDSAFRPLTRSAHALPPSARVRLPLSPCPQSCDVCYAAYLLVNGSAARQQPLSDPFAPEHRDRLKTLARSLASKDPADVDQWGKTTLRTRQPGSTPRAPAHERERPHHPPPHTATTQHRHRRRANPRPSPARRAGEHYHSAPEFLGYANTLKSAQSDRLVVHTGCKHLTGGVSQAAEQAAEGAGNGTVAPAFVARVLAEHGRGGKGRGGRRSLPAQSAGPSREHAGEK